MDCNMKRAIVQARAERLLQYAFVITGKDIKQSISKWHQRGPSQKTQRKSRPFGDQKILQEQPPSNGSLLGCPWKWS